MRAFRSPLSLRSAQSHHWRRDWKLHLRSDVQNRRNEENLPHFSVASREGRTGPGGDGRLLGPLLVERDSLALALNFLLLARLTAASVGISGHWSGSGGEDGASAALVLAGRL
ncbi:hypothetical protein MTO96_031231 [Rhipicephalus appendiculatus]